MRATLVGAVVRGVCLARAAAAQNSIVVDVNSEAADVSRMPIGINVNFLLDDDRNRHDPLRWAATDLGFQRLRVGSISIGSQ
jgi:hypothetical protein